MTYMTNRRYYVAKQKPWRDEIAYRFPSPEFPKPFKTCRAAWRAINKRHNDGAWCVVVCTDTQS